MNLRVNCDPAFVAALLQDLCRAPRAAGSARNAAVAAGLAARYRGMGYDVRLHTSSFTGWELTAPPRVRLLSPQSRGLADCLPVVWSGSTPGPITGRVVPGAAGLPPTVTTFGAYPWTCLPVVDDVTGVPAACLLTGPHTWPQPRDDETDPLPFVMIGPLDGAFIQDCLGRGVEVRVRVEVGSRYLPDRTLTNVVARGKGESDGPAVVVGAHYDSFFNTVGAHDNASGTAALLCLARRVAARAGEDSMVPARRGGAATHFICFDAEEWNKLGSSRYVESLERGGRLSQVKAMINIDSVGAGDGIYLGAAPAYALSLAAALRAMASGGGAGSGGASEVLGRRRVVVSPDAHAAPFDSWSFARRGIPAVQVGSFGKRPFAHWHRPEDDLSGISREGIGLICDVATLVEGLLGSWELEGSG